MNQRAGKIIRFALCFPEKQQQCDCPGQSCPGECPGMDKNKAEKPKPDKKKQS